MIIMPEKTENKIEHYTWADKIVSELGKRGGKEHVCHGMWTPSGYFHIGNARNELIAPMLIRDTLLGNGANAVFNFFVDDFDDLDKIPEGVSVPKGFEEHMGRPLYEVPSPVSDFKSWSDYFSRDVLDTIEEFGMKPNIFSSYEQYHKGTYDNAIRIVLNNWQKARDIWVKVSKAQKPADWIPVMPVCENCRRATTTTAVSWDREKLRYKCDQNRPYAQACGYEGEIVPGKGNVKLPWRLHWPATWFTFRVTFETAGKDHFASGGSVDTGKVLCREIFGYDPPYMMRGDFVTVKGKKISGSKGGVVSIKDWTGIADPELLRFIYIAYHPTTAIELDIGSGKFFLLTDRYDEAESCYYGSQSVTEKMTQQLKRQYELAQTKKLADEKPVRVNYATLSMLLQVIPHKTAEGVEKMLLKMGTLKHPLNVHSRGLFEKRIGYVQNWLERYAPDDVKIRINSAVSQTFALTLKDSEKAALLDLAKALHREWSEAELQTEIYETARKHNIEPKNFFWLLYQAILGKDAGPKLGPFILAAGKEKIGDLLKQVK